jgi:regulator of replication initiation timing
MNTDKIVFWLITTLAGLGITIIIIGVKIFLSATNEKINTLFSKFDDLLEKIGKLVNENDFNELEKRVRKIERKMDRCPSCNKVKDTE